MSVVISQPMLFPWIGMLEQARLASCFVHYPDVQFSKGSRVNRVQIKTAYGSRWMSVPLRDHKLGQRIDEVRIDDSRDWRREHLDQLRAAYAAAPHFDEMLNLVESVYENKHDDIGSLSTASFMMLCRYYGLDHDRTFLDSRQLGIDGASSRRVLDIVRALHEDSYITGHGASHYLDHSMFEHAGVRVEYMDYVNTRYPQLHGDFTPYVSALDLIANLGSAGVDCIRSTTIHWKDFLRDRRNLEIPG
jgi:hypothetical protein